MTTRDIILRNLQDAQTTALRARNGFVARVHHCVRTWDYYPILAAQQLPALEAAVADHLDALGEDILARLNGPVADELDAARWDALTAERDALAAQVAAVEQLATTLERRALCARGITGVRLDHSAQLIRKALA